MNEEMHVFGRSPGPMTFVDDQGGKYVIEMSASDKVELSAADLHDLWRLSPNLPEDHYFTLDREAVREMMREWGYEEA